MINKIDIVTKTKIRKKTEYTVFFVAITIKAESTAIEEKK